MADDNAGLDKAESIGREQRDQQRKTAEAVQDVKTPESEQATTRSTTPSVEKPGQEPTRPERPKA